MRVARATFDPSLTAGQRTIAAHGLGVTIPDNAIVVVDTGHAGMWMGGMYDLKSPTQSYMRSAGHLGWAFPAGLGAKCGAPERPVILVDAQHHDGALHARDDVFGHFLGPAPAVTLGQERRQRLLPIVEIDADAILEFRDRIADFECQMAQALLTAVAAQAAIATRVGDGALDPRVRLTGTPA